MSKEVTLNIDEVIDFIIDIDTIVGYVTPTDYEEEDIVRERLREGIEKFLKDKE